MASCALQVVCAAAENADVPLRRSEKKILNALNSKAARRAEEHGASSSYAVMAERGGRKLRDRVQEPWEKLFILVRTTFVPSHILL